MTIADHDKVRTLCVRMPTKDFIELKKISAETRVSMSKILCLYVRYLIAQDEKKLLHEKSRVITGPEKMMASQFII